MPTIFLSELASVALLCFVAMRSGVDNKVLLANPNLMTDKQLVETLADAKWAQVAFGEIVDRLEKNGYDRNSPLAKQLADTWKSTDDLRIKRLRNNCFVALCLVRSQEVVDVLCRQLLEGSTRRERASAAKSLSRMRGEDEAIVAVLRTAIAQDAGVFGEGRSIAQESISALGSKGSAGAKALKEIWGSAGERRGCEEVIITAMGDTRDKSFTPFLIDLLQGEQELVRDNAAWALGEIGDKAALPVLKKYERDPNAQIRENVAVAIEKIQQASAADK